MNRQFLFTSDRIHDVDAVLDTKDRSEHIENKRLKEDVKTYYTLLNNAELENSYLSHRIRVLTL